MHLSWLLALLPGSLEPGHGHCSSSSRKPASKTLNGLQPWAEISDHLKEKGDRLIQPGFKMADSEDD